ncbi:MAG: trypsin-like peptidase domain-containing protein, partial [Clostridia bacterium]
MKSKLIAALMAISMMIGLTGNAGAVSQVAKVTSSVLYVDGNQVICAAYNIGGANYFKLRDLACAFSGTTKQFNVTWDASKTAINMISGVPYERIGGELTGGVMGDKSATKTTSSIYLNGDKVSFNAYNIGGANYFKLRDVMNTFNIGVDWDAMSNTIRLDSSKDYDNNDNNADVGNLTLTQMAKFAESVVLIYNADAKGNAQSLGSGFVIANDGTIVTNYHVIEGASQLVIQMADGKQYPITQVSKYDAKRDIAILRADAIKGHAWLSLGDSSKVVVGQSVVAIGSPLGLQNTVSDGIVSSLRQSDRVQGATDIQTTTPISNGSSGGPLFDMFGKVIGVNYAGYDEGQNLNFAIPINEVKALMSSTAPSVPPEITQTPTESLSKRYKSVSIDGETIKIAGVYLDYDDEKEGQILAYIDVVDSESIINVYKLLAEGKSIKLSEFTKAVTGKIREEFPDYMVFG